MGVASGTPLTATVLNPVRKRQRTPGPLYASPGRTLPARNARAAKPLGSPAPDPPDPDAPPPIPCLAANVDPFYGAHRPSDGVPHPGNAACSHEHCPSAPYSCECPYAPLGLACPYADHGESRCRHAACAVYDDFEQDPDKALLLLAHNTNLGAFPAMQRPLALPLALAVALVVGIRNRLEPTSDTSHSRTVLQAPLLIDDSNTQSLSEQPPWELLQVEKQN